MAFIYEHPWLSTFMGIWLVIAILGWLFIAGAAIASGEDLEHDR
jgi:hypothetical protein